jgi:hypothetical protein
MIKEIYSNDHLKIMQHDDTTNIFKIELKKPNPVLLLSLTKFIKGSTCSDDYLLLTFKAYSVEMLPSYKEKSEKSSICTAANVLTTLTSQLKYLFDEYIVTFLGFNPENIMVINDHTFLSLDIELMTEIDENNITFFTPFTSRDFFFSPELKRATKLPCIVHYKTAYFSLGCLLLYVLLGYDDAFYREYLLLDSENMEQLFKKYLANHPIKETKLYWLIERCLVEEPEKRSILFI